MGNTTNEIVYQSAALGEDQRQIQEDTTRRHHESSSSSGRCCLSSGERDLSERMVHAIFLLLGVGILIPWNAFVSAAPYFTSRLCQSGHDVINFEQWFGLVSNLSAVVSLGLTILVQSFSDFRNQKQKRSLAQNLGGTNDDTEGSPPESRHLVDEAHPEDTTNRRSVDLAGTMDGEDRSQGSSFSSPSSLAGTTKDSFYNVMVPMGLYIIVFSMQALLVTIPDISPTNFLLYTLVGLALCGTCQAFATAGIISTAGLFPSHVAINPFTSGQALGGAAVSIVNFVASALGEDPNDYLEKHCSSPTTTTNYRHDDRNGPALLTGHATSSAATITTQRWLDGDFETLGTDELGGSCSSYQNLDWAVLSYFLAGCFVLLFCMVGYRKIYQHQNNTRHRDAHEVVQHHNDSQRDGSGSGMCHSGDGVYGDAPRIGRETNNCFPLHQEQLERYNSGDGIMLQSVANGATSILDLDEWVANETSSSRVAALSAMPGNAIDDEGESDENRHIQEQDAFDEEGEEYTDIAESPKSVFSIIKGPAICIFLNFTVTLSVFPSWISQLKSSHECENRFRLNNDLYIPFSFVVFNIGDLLGRLVSGYIPVVRIQNLSQKLVVCAALRALLLPMFLVCNTAMGKDSSIVVRNDFFSLLVQLLFAVSNGILVSISFMLSPQLIGTNLTSQERASKILTFAVSFGLLSGSFLAFPFLKLASLVLSSNQKY